MKRMILAIAALLAGIGVYYAFADHKPAEPVNNQASEQIKVVASFYLLAHFVEQVGGNHVTVTNVTPSGAEPHDFEPSPKQIVDIYGSKLLIANGSGLDPWADAIKSELTSKGVSVIFMSEHFALLAGIEDNEEEEEEGHEEESLTDPHFWLDPKLVEQEVHIIKDELIKVDAAHASDYQKNADEYVAELQQLDQRYQQDLATCQTRDIVTSHAAFGYLAKRYNLNQIPIAGISPDEEPSPAHIAEVATLAKEKNIKVIFFETLISPKLAETIAKEIGAQTEVFNPLEGLTDEEVAQGKNYISVMEDNLAKLRSALQCS